MRVKGIQYIFIGIIYKGIMASTRHTLRVLVCCCFVFICQARPSQDKEQQGPCVGMECLHGVLMHGDEKLGEGHAKQDLYEKLQRQDVQNAEKRVIGPCEGEDCMEMLQHAGEDPNQVHKMEEKPGPKPEEHDSPCLDCLHGVLMHGDSEPGKHHAAEHDRARLEEQKKHDGKIPSVDPDAVIHTKGSAHVHDPVNHIKREDTEGEKKIPKVNDMESILHGGEHVDHDKVVKAEDKVYPDSKVGDLEALLHGGEHVDHDKKVDTEDKVQPASLVGDLEALLHGGEHVDHNAKPDPGDQQKYPVPKVANLEELLHGSEGAHVHTKKKVPGEGSEPSRKESGTLDPHALLHGEHDIGVGGLSHEEMEEYREWKRDQELENEASGLQFSFPKFASSILNEIKLLKQRYLPVLWGPNPKPDDFIDGEDERDVPLSDPEKEEDMRNEMAEIGSTLPLSETNKIKLKRQEQLKKMKRANNEI